MAGENAANTADIWLYISTDREMLDIHVVTQNEDPLSIPQ
jgi:hypothetical protein